MLDAHFVTLWLIFTPPGCQAKRKVASRSDHDRPTHPSSLKRIPIWVLERKSCWGTNETPQLGRFSPLLLGFICSPQEEDGPNGSQLRFGEAVACGGPKTCSPIKASAAPVMLSRFLATWRASAGEPTGACDHHPAAYHVESFHVCLYLHTSDLFLH